MPLCTDTFPTTPLLALAASVGVALCPVMGGLAPPSTDTFMLAIVVEFALVEVLLPTEGGLLPPATETLLPALMLAFVALAASARDPTVGGLTPPGTEIFTAALELALP